MATQSLDEIIGELWNTPGMAEDQGPPSQRVFGDDWGADWNSQERVIVIRSSERNAVPVFDTSEPREITQGASGKRIDALAFYYSYHYSRRHWGIYLTYSGIWQVANEFIADGVDISTALTLAQEFLIRHELGHFQSDIGVTQLEMTKGTPLYIPGRKKILGKSPGYDEVEEGLCTAFSVQEIKKFKKSLDFFLASLPPGYADWAKYKIPRSTETWNKIFKDYLPLLDTYSSISGYIPKNIATLFLREVPIYYINDLSSIPTASLFLAPIQNVIETDDFKKDLDRLAKGQPVYRKKWLKTQEKLKHSVVMVHLEKITDRHYSVQLDYEARVGLERSGNWLAIAADHHDKLYKRLNALK